MTRTNRLFLAVFAVFLAFAPLRVWAQDDAARKRIAEAFGEFAKEQMAKDQIPGISVGYAMGGQTWTNGYGFSDIENDAPARAESMYRMASVNKPMTAAAILLLVERGKIDLDKEIQEYVPYFPKKEFPVTVRQVLGHLGGISHYKDYNVEGKIREQKTTREAIEIFADFPLVAEPGTKNNYSSYGYNLLGAVIEGASGMSYGEFMTENVFRPLGMNSTRLDNPEELIRFRVNGYRLEKGKIVNSEYVNISSRFAAGGIRSTVGDMLRFGTGVYEGKLLSKQSLSEVYEPMYMKDGTVSYYGAGWRNYPSNGRFLISHSGGQPETATYLFVFPSRKLSIAVAANLEGARTENYAAKLFELLTGEKWNVEFPNAKGDLAASSQIMKAVFEEGRGSYERGIRSNAFTKSEIVRAFEMINETASAKYENDDAASMAVAKLRTKDSGRKCLVAGVYITEKLVDAGKDPAAYSNLGAGAFFKDFIALGAKGLPEKSSKIPEGISQLANGK
ncbi:MAG: serine hydrolase domain-containing protein [Pyrinomonadaceae bacterium]